MKLADSGMLNNFATPLSENLGMDAEIWDTLSSYEGRWVAVDRGGRVVAEAATLADLITASAGWGSSLTFLYAAPVEDLTTAGV